MGAEHVSGAGRKSGETERGVAENESGAGFAHFAELQWRR